MPFHVLPVPQYPPHTPVAYSVFLGKFPYVKAVEFVPHLVFQTTHKNGLDTGDIHGTAPKQFADGANGFKTV
jgi:hypothetical protein